MDNGQNLINDFKTMALSSGNWSELRVARKKEERKRMPGLQSFDQSTTAAATRIASATDLQQ